MIAESSKTKDEHFNAQDFLAYAISHEFGDLHFKVDPKSGLKAIIAIHNTKLGPALGGCRFIEYANTESAILDAMRLARGMSYKAASVNLPLGGGKAVIIKPKENFDRNAYFEAFGQFVEELNGRYITALDSGTIIDDMEIIGQKTNYVASKRNQGDPSPYTARGVLRGIEASVAYKLNKSNLDGIHVAIQGLGHVGFALAEMLHERGAILTVADINPTNIENAVNKFKAQVVDTSKIHSIACDVYSPCALGAVLNDHTIPQLNTSIIAGAANNQLAHTYHGEILADKGILFAPDYVINAGGLIFAGHKYLKKSDETILQEVDNIHDLLLNIFDRASQEKLATNQVSDLIAKEKLN